MSAELWDALQFALYWTLSPVVFWLLVIWVVANILLITLITLLAVYIRLDDFSAGGPQSGQRR